MNICSAHREKDPDCTACNAVVEFPEPTTELVTCPRCNFVYYEASDICPKCYKSPL